MFVEVQRGTEERNGSGTYYMGGNAVREGGKGFGLGAIWVKGGTRREGLRTGRIGKGTEETE